MKPTSKALLVAGALAATTAVAYAQYRTYDARTIFTTPTGQAFLQAFDALSTQYLKPVDQTKLMQGAVKGMAESLNDKFIYYFPPEDANAKDDDLRGEFFGIGALIGAVNSDGSGAEISGVYKDQPAARAGVRSGDRILKVNGEDVSTLYFNKVVQKIRGPKGTDVVIVFARGNTTFTATMKRSPVTIVSVESTMLPGNVGYIALNTFYNEKVFQQFGDAVNAMEKKGVNKLVLDLRDNGGGLLQAGIDVANRFLTSGPIVSLRGRDGKAQVVGSATQQPGDYTGKLVVLVNGNSASASEIVAGALQDTGRATIVGEKTFGKGVAQTPVTLADQSELDVVTQEWLTPKGRGIQGKGITPDVSVADNRYPKLFTLTGAGAQPGQKVSVKIGDRTVNLTADKDGNLSFTDTPKRREVSTVQGQAVVDPKGDAELARALQLLSK